MLLGRRGKGRISGMVFHDSNNNGIKDVEEKGFKGVKIRLYTVRMLNPGEIGGNARDVEVLKEKFLAETVTDEKGKYFFDVLEGRYSLKLDVHSLPAGMGVVEQNILLDKPVRSRNFAVRDVASIEAADFKKQVFVGERLHVNPVLKDKDGNRLAACVEYSTDREEYDFETHRLQGSWRSLGNNKLYINVKAGSKSEKFPVEFRMPDVDSVHRVRLAYHSGLIDQNSRMLNLLYSIFDRSRLPREFSSDIPIKSGTTVLHEVSLYLQGRDADPQVVQTAKRYGTLSPPKLDREYISPSGYFRIHYTTKGSHAVSTADSDGKGTPGYIRLIGDAFDNVRAVTCISRGFKTPVLDQGKKTFDVYVYDLKGKYGVTVANAYVMDGGSGRKTASCYISIDNTYAPSKGFKKDRNDCMKVTAAHEFFHAVQYAYTAGAETWWMEASATWNEDEIYDGVNDYIRYLESTFASPEKSLEENSYGGVAFVKYISEHRGGYSTVKRIWELHASTSKSIEAIDRAIREKYKGEDLSTIYNAFTACNFNPPQYYKEGSLWTVPIACQNTYFGYPVKTREASLNHLAANYQLFKDFTPGNNTLRILVDGEDKMKWGFKVQKRRTSDGKCDLTEVSVSGVESRAEILCRNCGNTYSEICLIPANLEKEKDHARYSYEANML